MTCAAHLLALALATSACSSTTLGTLGDGADARTEERQEATDTEVPDDLPGDISDAPAIEHTDAAINDVPGATTDAPPDALDGRLVDRSLRSCPSDGSGIGCGAAIVQGGTCLAIYTPRGTTPLRVTVSTFALDRYEVSVDRFRRFYQAGMPNMAQVVRYRGGEWRPHVYVPYEEPRRIPDAGTGADSPDRFTWDPVRGDPRLPVVRINQTIAQAFCVWDGGRLPTETEMRYLLQCWPNGGREVIPTRFMLGNEPASCDDGNWGGQGEVRSGPCPLRVSRIAPGGRFRPYGPFYDLIGNVEEWRADRCEPMQLDGPDRLCVNGTHETSAGRTDVSWYFFAGGSIDLGSTELRASPGSFYSAVDQVPHRRAEWMPSSSPQDPMNRWLFGFRCAYDVP